MKEKAGQLIYFFHEISASISTVCLKENKTRVCVCSAAVWLSLGGAQTVGGGRVVTLFHHPRLGGRHTHLDSMGDQ
jgi:hypothetical protein